MDGWTEILLCNIVPFGAAAQKYLTIGMWRFLCYSFVGTPRPLRSEALQESTQAFPCPSQAIQVLQRPSQLLSPVSIVVIILCSITATLIPYVIQGKGTADHVTLFPSSSLPRANKMGRFLGVPPPCFRTCSDPGRRGECKKGEAVGGNDARR